MKTSQNILAKVAVLGMVLGLLFGIQTTDVQAQNGADVTISMKEVSLQSRGHHLAIDSRLALPNAVSDLTQSQISEQRAIANRVVSSITAARLENGAIKISMPVTKNVQALIDEETLNVKISYDARPIGGILNVQVSMTPSFRGVGVATRPTISRSTAIAVDELNDATVQKLVRELTLELQAELALENSRELTVKR